MSVITKKIMKEVEEIVDHRCDICGEILPRHWDWKANEHYELNTLKYTNDLANGTKTEKHVCSARCFIESLKYIYFNCNIHLTNDLIKELIKEFNKREV